ncbi:MAG: hypothetical protein ACPG77_05360 [Nannocystaceae bacterium]
MSTRLPFASHQLLTSAIGLALSLGLLSSCDEFIPEPTEAGKPVEPQIAPPPAEPTAEQQAQAVASVYEYANCAGSCFTSGEHKAPTNHATCRLNCKQALDTSLAKQAMRLPALAAVPELNKQLDGCKAETSADNRATCMLTCTNKIREEARSLKLEPDAVPPKQDSCGSKCSARLELCTDKCTSDRKQSADDRATCNLMCKTEETTCRETCAKTQPGTLK